MQLAKGEFGGRVGIWRLIELFDATASRRPSSRPGASASSIPQALRAAAKSGHELADHMWEHRVPKEPELERDHLLKTDAALERISGRRPVGSRSHHSPTLLRDEGYIYNSHGAADHRPYYVLDADGRNLPARSCRSTSPSTTRCSSASPGTPAPMPSSGSPTPTACSTCGGRASCSSIGRADTSTSACIPSCRAAPCASPCSTA